MYKAELRLSYNEMLRHKSMEKYLHYIQHTVYERSSQFIAERTRILHPKVPTYFHIQIRQFSIGVCKMQTNITSRTKFGQLLACIDRRCERLNK